jgi:4-hydroxy-4-methyl-2-oxoglutarate aldolase
MPDMPVESVFPEWSAAVIADACVHAGIGARVAPPGLRPVAPGTRACGRALPAKHSGSVDVFFEAFERGHAGDVLVIDNDGALHEGCIGDLVVLEALNAGMKGLVVWGAHRDTAELLRLSLPVFSYGVNPAGPPGLRPRPGDALTSARVGPVIVTADDFVFADMDGAVFVSEGSLPEVLRVARIIWETERRQAQLTAEGRSLREQFQFADYLARRAANPGYTFREHLRNMGLAIEE